MSNQSAFNNFRVAAQHAHDHGYPINPVAAAAQACHETGFGQHVPTKSNNVLGIKVGSGWTGPAVNSSTFEYLPDGTKVNDVSAWFRAYPSIEACFEDYGKIIQSLWWFKDAAAQADGDPFDYLTALKPIYGPDGKEVKEPGYFTDPKYVVNVMKIVQQYAKPAQRYPALEGISQLWVNNELMAGVAIARPVGHKLFVRTKDDESLTAKMRTFVMKIFAPRSDHG